MNILWITNIEFPEATQLITGSGELKATGGWLLGASKALLNGKRNINLTVATVSSRVKQLTRLEGQEITYYMIPYGKGNLHKNKEYIPYWKRINIEVAPDVVHIHGTEFSHGLAYVDACGADNVVVSIQGMKSAYYYYYYYGVTKWEILKNITIRDIFRGSPLKGQRLFKKQSEYEIELLQKVKHIIGRTSWDRARTWAINPDAKYHFCNETLRDEFYNGDKWSHDTCKSHSIFVSQAGYPIKGVHQLLKAMPFILREYPDTTIRVAGFDITRNGGIWGLKHFTTYGRIVRKMIYRYNLVGKVEFLGNLNAVQMKSEYLHCNVFVSPSSIENSPNSVGEAQILGTPIIASYVGGVADMMKSNEVGLYRFEETEMLAYKICEIFKGSNPQMDMSLIANQRHSPKKNQEDLLAIYESVYNNSNIMKK